MLPAGRDNMSSDERVLADVRIATRAADVWHALRDPERVHGWFGWDYDGLAAEIEEIFVGQAAADDDARTLTWADGDRLEVEEVDGGTSRVRVARRAPASPVYDAVDEGWITFVQQLRFWLERHPGVPRRTVSAIGVDLGPADDPLLARLGLRELGDEPVGSGYGLRVDDAPIGGEVVFQTDLQLGLSVADAGDALLVIARTPPDAAPPDGTAMFVLSTYGLDDDAFRAVERRWSAWWS